ncbi:unnamed protein product [Candidula unifasciata]|uniref:G-protein coupled receptors family 1 profile domain-containing protein n=1 Tax=Candidula unifasciata TaxID=100452 RepID=A0A8S3ZQC0_9EUPU|nr:unnamed protein product [Candidula unifasciata]
MADLLYKHRDPFTIVLILAYVSTFIVGFLEPYLSRQKFFFFLNKTVHVFLSFPLFPSSDWIYGETLCKMSPFLQSTAVAVSVMSMLSISINRHFAIHVPLRAKILFSRSRVHVMLVTTWIVSLATSSPLLVVRSLTSYGIPGVFEARACSENWNSALLKHSYNLVAFLLLFLLPLTLMSVVYLKISLALWSKNTELFDFKRKQTFKPSQVDRLLLQRRKTVRTLVLLVAVFACSWLPYYVVNAWLDFNITSLVALSNSSVNPIVYCFLSSGFRRAFINMCCRRKLRTRRGMTLTVRYKCSEDSGVGSIETALS